MPDKYKDIKEFMKEPHKEYQFIIGKRMSEEDKSFLMNLYKNAKEMQKTVYQQELDHLIQLKEENHA